VCVGLILSSFDQTAGIVEQRAEEEAGSLALPSGIIRLAAAVPTLKSYSKALEYEYRVKTAALGTLKRYSIISLTLYLE
jgi:hypothetical protein